MVLATPPSPVSPDYHLIFTRVLWTSLRNEDKCTIQITDLIIHQLSISKEPLPNFEETLQKREKVKYIQEDTPLPSFLQR
jgi:hypothetical protein